MRFKEFRIEGQIGDTRSPATVKRILEYTPGDINERGSWMTDKAANVETLTSEKGDFNKALGGKKIITLAVPKNEMRINSYAENQIINKYKILWFNNPPKDSEDIFRMIILYHVKVGRVKLRNFTGFTDADYFEVILKVQANIEYLDKFGGHV